MLMGWYIDLIYGHEDRITQHLVRFNQLAVWTLICITQYFYRWTAVILTPGEKRKKLSITPTGFSNPLIKVVLKWQSFGPLGETWVWVCPWLTCLRLRQGLLFWLAIQRVYSGWTDAGEHQLFIWHQTVANWLQPLPKNNKHQHVFLKEDRHTHTHTSRHCHYITCWKHKQT